MHIAFMSLSGKGRQVSPLRNSEDEVAGTDEEESRQLGAEDSDEDLTRLLDDPARLAKTYKLEVCAIIYLPKPPL
jgi:hypothetical protein